MATREIDLTVDIENVGKRGLLARASVEVEMAGETVTIRGFKIRMCAGRPRISGPAAAAELHVDLQRLIGRAVGEAYLRACGDR